MRYLDNVSLMNIRRRKTQGLPRASSNIDHSEARREIATDVVAVAA